MNFFTFTTKLLRTFLLAVVFVTVSVGTAAAQNRTFTDSRDGQTYKTTKIANQTWMAQNLNYRTGKSWCYDNNNSNCNKYGRLYDWNTAMRACPSGWYLPSGRDWQLLVKNVGGEFVASKKLKATRGWNNGLNGSEGGGTDDYGFSGLPGGSCIYYEDEDYSHFAMVGIVGHWWSATDFGDDEAYIRIMSYNLEQIEEFSVEKSSGQSVRCIQK